MFTEKRRHFANKRFKKEDEILNDYMKLIDKFAEMYGNEVYAVAYQYYEHHEPHATRTGMYSKLMNYLEFRMLTSY